MNVLVASEEQALREELASLLRGVEPDASVLECDHRADALASCRERPVDVAFVDAEMSGGSGLALAKEMQRLRPRVNVVVVATTEQCAYEAFKIHASGFYLRPITAAHVQDALANLRHPVERTRLEVRCFGQFEVLWGGVPLRFARKKTRELLAFLIDRRGALCSPEEVIAALWEHAGDDVGKAKHRVRNLVGDLRATLRAIGMEDVLVRHGQSMAVRCDLVDCDYYRMLDGGALPSHAFSGGYMEQYSWAEATKGRLTFWLADKRE